jgi:DNA-binding response OmpR family regulator
MAAKILVVDDEKRLVALVEAYLTQEGYGVVTASNGQEALHLARQEKPDLILLDIMMPEMDGFEFIQAHRREADTAIILLTARVEEEDHVIGLELGADDYVTKPFRPRELVARVRAVLRRTGKGPSPTEVLRVGQVTLDREGHLVKVASEQVDLTPSEFDLLSALMSTPGPWLMKATSARSMSISKTCAPRSKQIRAIRAISRPSMGSVTDSLESKALCDPYAPN